MTSTSNIFSSLNDLLTASIPIVSSDPEAMTSSNPLSTVDTEPQNTSSAPSPKRFKLLEVGMKWELLLLFSRDS